MNTLPYYKDYPVKLASGIDTPSFRVRGQWIACRSAGEEFLLSLEGGPGLSLDVGEQIGWGESREVQLQFYPKPGATVFPNEILVRVGVGEYRDARLNIVSGTAIQSLSAAMLSAPAVDVVLVAATNTLIAAANSARRCIRITNLGTVTARIASDVADLSATRGEVVQPGECREIFVTGPIYARSTGTPTLNVAEEVF